MAGNARNPHVVRRRRNLWAGVLALVGLILLVVGLTATDGVAAWVEVVVAAVLLLTSYLVQAAARRQTAYRREDRR